MNQQATPPPENPDAEHSPSMRDAMETYAQRSGLRRDSNGQLDVLHAVGGWRGLAESIIPGTIFLVVFLLGQALMPALVAALASAVVFTGLRLVQRQSVAQSIAGLVGVVICAFFARAGGQALDYYVPGFFINAAWLLGLTFSSVIGWPLLGVLFGYVRGEDMKWRGQPRRRRVYQRSNGILILMFAARLVVQLPLYFDGNVAALGTARLVMGVPLYALTLWLAWLTSRPAPQEVPEKTP